MNPCWPALVSRLRACEQSTVQVLCIGLTPPQAQAWAEDLHMAMRVGQRLQLVALVGALSGHTRRAFDSGVTLTLWPGHQPQDLRASIGRFHGVVFAQTLHPANAQTQDWAKALRAHVWCDSWLLAPGPKSPQLEQQWRPQGWAFEGPGDGQGITKASHVEPTLQATFAPRWAHPRAPQALDRRISVIGAGLAGAACVHQLSLRGWQVQWLDQSPHWASGASALPVGMLSPHRTAQPTPMSELAEWGLPATLEQLRQHVPQGEGWVSTWVDNLPSTQGGPPPGRDRAYLVEPAALVQAWAEQALATGRVTWRGGVSVKQLQAIGPNLSPDVLCDDEPHTGTAWQLRDTEGQCVSETPFVIAANAHGAHRLLGDAMPHIRPVAGQMSWAPWPLEEPPVCEQPRRAHGVLTPYYASRHGPIWAVGSTYRRGVAAPQASESDHDANAESLMRLCPSARGRFDAQRQSGAMRAFVGVRCASADRLPLIGAVPQANATWPARGGLEAVPRQAGLYTLTALGSRGLTLAAWAAQLLADQIESLPLAAPAHLVKACDPGRKGLLRSAA